MPGYGARPLLALAVGAYDERRLDMIADPFRQKRRRGERLGFDRIDLLQIAIPVQMRINRDEPVKFGREQLGELRSEEHTSELQSLMRISYAVFCLKKKKATKTHPIINSRNSNQNTKKGYTHKYHTRHY